MKYNEIEQDTILGVEDNGVNNSNEVEIDDCVGEGCFVKVPIEDLQNRVLFSEPQAIYYCLKNRLNVINSKKKEKTDVVEMSCREIMYVVGGEKKHFTRNRQKLIEAGLIDVLKQAKNQNEKTLYRVRSRQNDVSGSHQNGVSGSHQNGVSGSHQNGVSDSEKNPSNSLENSTLQSLPETPNNIIKEDSFNIPPKSPKGLKGDFSDVEGDVVSTKDQRTKEEIKLRAQKQNRQPNVSDSVKNEENKVNGEKRKKVNTQPLSPSQPKPIVIDPDPIEEYSKVRRVAMWYKERYYKNGALISEESRKKRWKEVCRYLKALVDVAKEDKLHKKYPNLLDEMWEAHRNIRRYSDDIPTIDSILYEVKYDYLYKRTRDFKPYADKVFNIYTLECNLPTGDGINCPKAFKDLNNNFKNKN